FPRWPAHGHLRFHTDRIRAELARRVQHEAPGPHAGETELTRCEIRVYDGVVLDRLEPDPDEPAGDEWLLAGDPDLGGQGRQTVGVEHPTNHLASSTALEDDVRPEQLRLIFQCDRHDIAIAHVSSERRNEIP